jgi:glutamate-ammonia-ligase adenylyltransferase
VKPETAAEMIEAYRFLRVIEHRLQMIEDRQTQTLPTAPAELEAFALFAGFDSTVAFSEPAVYPAMWRITTPNCSRRLPGGPGNLVFTGTDNDPETVQTLAMGFSDALRYRRSSAAGITAATGPCAAPGRGNC